MRSNLPTPYQWTALNSISFCLAVQLFVYGMMIALAITFLDQAHLPAGGFSVAGTLLWLTIEILLVGPLIGLIMALYPCAVLGKLGISRKAWLLATVVGAIGGYGFLIITQFARAYLTGLQILFDPSILQCLVAATVMASGPWYVLHRYRLSTGLWIVITIVALGTAIFTVFALKHASLWMQIAAVLAIGIVYSVLMYQSLIRLEIPSSLIS